MAEAHSQKSSKKRKLDEEELEIDIDAPEPPSKKAQRKAKKLKASKGLNPMPTTEDADLKRLNGLEGERSKFGIWIGNLSFTTNKRDLYRFLITNPDCPLAPDQITRIHLPPGTDRRSENKGFAYVDLKTQDLVNTALNLSESLLAGRRLLIKDAKSFQGRPELTKPKPEASPKPPNRKIFVGNLDFDTTVPALEKHFEVCGAITKTQLATFEDSGKCKGYGWVEFESLSSAETAMRGWTEIRALGRKTRQGQEAVKKVWLHRMGDRKLRMEYAEDSTTRYNKRYGKNAKSGPAEDADGDVSNARKSAEEDLPAGRKGAGNSAKKRSSKRRESASKISNPRYDEQTVQKLTGAIVEGQGSKVTF